MTSHNRETSSARAYHERTAHSPRSVRASGHRLDWANEPRPFKIYPDLPPIALPRDFPAATLDTLAALSGGMTSSDPLDLARLAAVLFLSAGVTRTVRYPGGGERYLRAAASTGALYQTEVYVVAGAVGDLAAGVYHFCPGDFALRRLREGDFRGALALAAGDEPMAERPAILVVTAIYWRNAWKYQARAYRHLFWDSGTMLANLLAVGDGLGLAPRVVTGFVDLEVNRLLGLDPSREVALELIALGPEAAAAPAGAPPASIDHATLPLSSSEVDYPLVRAIHAASSLATATAVSAWREGAWRETAPPAGAKLVALPSPRER